MSYQNLEQNIAIPADGNDQQEAAGTLSIAQGTSENEADLGDNITWGQIKSGYQEYKQRAASARAAAKAVGRS